MEYYLLRVVVRIVLCYRPRMSHRVSLCLVVGAAVVFAALAATARVAAAGPLFVSTAGNDANDCQTFGTACRTVGAAVGKASAGDVIIITSGTYTEGVTLDKNLTLIGFGSDATIISGADISQVLQISAGVTASVYDLAIVHGYPGILNSGILTLTNSVVSYNVDSGIANEGHLTVNSSSIHDNHAFVGAGLHNYHGTASVNHSTILSNSVNESGAGINSEGGKLTVDNSVIANNVACNTSGPFVAMRPSRGKLPDNGYGSSGGGIDSSGGVLTITNSTISGNTVMAGGPAGGLLNGSAASISNTTISGNMAAYAAGIHNVTVMTLTNVTLSGNVNDNIRNLGMLWMRNTIVDNGDCTANAVVSLGHNLDSGNTCGLHASGDMTSTNPLLGPLQNNGGPTPTHALLPGSPAINRGDNNDCPPTDQRGIVRPQAGICDIGAFEYVFPYATFLPVVKR